MRTNPRPREIITPRGPDTIPAMSGEHKLPDRQNGVVLFIVLIVLVAMTLAGIALVRSVDTGNMIAGNLAFKQGATLAGDAGTEAAITWLQTIQKIAGSASFDNDQQDAGYYADTNDHPDAGYYADTLDMTSSSNDPKRALVDWSFNNCNGATTPACIRPAQPISAGAGNMVTYIIHRLCQGSGEPNSSSNTCANYIATSSTSPKKGEMKYGGGNLSQPLPQQYYRITSRTVGPRNTVSFVETIIRF